MTALSTREALAEHEPVLGTFAGAACIVGCTCLSARDYRAAGYRAGQAGWRDHLFASGAVVDVTTLASPHDRRDVTVWLLREADQRVKFFPQRRDGVDALLRALAAALTERAQ